MSNPSIVLDVGQIVSLTNNSVYDFMKSKVLVISVGKMENNTIPEDILGPKFDECTEYLEVGQPAMFLGWHETKAFHRCLTLAKILVRSQQFLISANNLGKFQPL